MSSPARITFFVWGILSIQYISSEHATGKIMLCRHCGEEILVSSELEHVSSKLALKTERKNILGKEMTPIQEFKNPNNVLFKIITAKKANIFAHENAYAGMTWFPGFAWRIAICPQCQRHLGWKFQPTNFNHVTHSDDDTFVGLILDHLLEQTESESLLLVPKAYNS